MQLLAENSQINSALPVSDENLAGRPPVGKLGDLPAMFLSESGRGEFICFLFIFWSDWSACASLISIYIFCSSKVVLWFETKDYISKQEI